MLTEEDEKKIKEGVRELIREHRNRASRSNKHPCKLCLGLTPDGIGNCLHCLEIFPMMIDFVNANSHRTNFFGLSACPCFILGHETASKIVAMYMGEY